MMWCEVMCVIHDRNELHAVECTLKPGSASHGAEEIDYHLSSWLA